MRYDEFYYAHSPTPDGDRWILYGGKDGRGHHLATFVNEESVKLAVKSMNEANKGEEE